jgi:transposase-like protein
VDGEVIVERRGRWSPARKAVLLAAVEAEGGQVSVVARRHGISTSLLYDWRSACRAALAVRARAAELVQLGVLTEASDESSMVPTAVGAVCPRGAGLALAERVGVIEIDLPDGGSGAGRQRRQREGVTAGRVCAAGVCMIALAPGTN